MVLKPEPMFNAVEAITEGRKPRVILMCPQGERFTQKKAEELALEDDLVLLCGHYEGYDERIREHLVTDEISIGDYVLTGGEIPAMVVVDAVARYIPNVLGNNETTLGLFNVDHNTMINASHVVDKEFIEKANKCNSLDMAISYKNGTYLSKEKDVLSNLYNIHKSHHLYYYFLQ